LTTNNFEELAAAEHQDEKTLQTTQLENANSRQRTGIPAKKTFWQNMKLFDGTYSDENLLALIIAAIAPFTICMNAAVCYIIVVQGWFVGLYVAIAFVLAQIFAYPPYNLNPQSIGYLSLAPFIGGLLAMLLFSVMALIVATSTYALDAYRDMNNEIFIMGMLFKNFLHYGFTYFINNWLAQTGSQHVFNVFGATGFGVMVGLPVMYVFGKNYRSYWHRHNLLEKFHIRTHAE
jgi:hypothetical protein